MNQPDTSDRPRERWWLYLVVPFGVLTAIGLVFTMAVIAFVGYKVEEADTKSQHEQAALQPFYTPPTSLPSGVGVLIRSEEIKGAAPKGSRVWRILYTSEHTDGTRTVSSGSVFVPDAPSVGVRPVLAWAHGTLGMADKCAPSRSNPQSDMQTWLPLAMANGWIVVATDYAGFGTPGTLRYLIGVDAARDVINSVRAIRGFKPAEASNRVVVSGHSQGGQSSLFTAAEIGTYAPELELVAATAAAPAAELNPLISQQWDKAVAWVIGAEVSVAWPKVYPDLDIQGTMTAVARKQYRRIANMCVKPAAIEALVRQKFLGQRFYATDVSKLPTWNRALREQTPKPLRRSIPTLIVQGMSDTVVLPNTTALLVERWCAAGSNVSTIWLGDTTHPQVALVSGPTVVDWIAQRFAGVPTHTTCGLPQPVQPAKE